MSNQLRVWSGWIAAAVLAMALVVVLIRKPAGQSGGQLPAASQQAPKAATGFSLPVTPRTAERAQLLLELEQQSKEAHEKFAELNRLSAGNPQAQNTNHHVFDKVNAAFVELGHKAGKGDEQAFQTLFDAMSMKYLQGSAVQGLGVAAGDGSEKAVDILVEPKKNGLLLSSVVGALRPAAEKGNSKAIKFLSGVTSDPASSALHGMAAGALEKPAGEGNDEAIAGLINLLDSKSEYVLGNVRNGLKHAALIGNVRARAAVAKKGW